jgi:hypothetical protein
MEGLLCPALGSSLLAGGGQIIDLGPFRHQSSKTSRIACVTFRRIFRTDACESPSPRRAMAGYSRARQQAKPGTARPKAGTSRCRRANRNERGRTTRRRLRGFGRLRDIPSCVRLPVTGWIWSSEPGRCSSRLQPEHEFEFRRIRDRRRRVRWHGTWVSNFP